MLMYTARLPVTVLSMLEITEELIITAEYKTVSGLGIPML